MSVKIISDDLLVIDDDIVTIDMEHIENVKNMAMSSKKRRARICLHKSDKDKVHEMIIAVCYNSYIRPHKHNAKMESFHLIEGEANILIFESNGSIKQNIKLGFGDNIVYRIDKDFYHTIVPTTPILVIHEVTNGPFIQDNSEYAEFSPEEGSYRVKEYKNMLRNINIKKDL
jgi:cupin fold WbuC family metalloprotein